MRARDQRVKGRVKAGASDDGSGVRLPAGHSLRTAPGETRRQ